MLGLFLKLAFKNEFVELEPQNPSSELLDYNVLKVFTCLPGAHDLAVPLVKPRFHYFKINVKQELFVRFGAVVGNPGFLGLGLLHAHVYLVGDSISVLYDFLNNHYFLFLYLIRMCLLPV